MFFIVGVHSHSFSSKVADVSVNNASSKTQSVPSNSRFVYPEFLPDPEPKYRNPIKEKLERQDMLNRR